MTDQEPPKSASQSLAEALARKKAAAQSPQKGRGRVQNDRDAAARSASKSIPAMRK